ncbi:hypothetical protein HPB50_017209 [Hyalomma asiaticum]|uniref:Uncharacterized protein n=1 Tax=Hyalomma asiaticum TaxID=266040 RepID=A0ACB7S684_HYAAI|nr:hypothetical protein HPB50_017209 [Hyalomma asiaticum]
MSVTPRCVIGPELSNRPIKRVEPLPPEDGAFAGDAAATTNARIGREAPPLSSPPSPANTSISAREAAVASGAQERSPPPLHPATPGLHSHVQRGCAQERPA